MEQNNDKIEQRLHVVNNKLIAAIKKLKAEISSRTEHERSRQDNSSLRKHSLLSAIIFKDTKGIVHTVVKVKSHISSHFWARCLNSQSMWELDTLTSPSTNGYCRALVNILRDNNYAWKDVCNINDFETIVKLS